MMNRSPVRRLLVCGLLLAAVGAYALLGPALKDLGLLRRALDACPAEGGIEASYGAVHVAAEVSMGQVPEGPGLFISFRVREVGFTARFDMRRIPLNEPLDGEGQ